MADEIINGLIERQVGKAFDAAYELGVKNERERCAKLCDKLARETWGSFEAAAAAIRKGE